MKILVLGSGGREHAIVWALNKTTSTPLTIFCAPGNPGISQIAKILPFQIDDYSAIIAFARSEQIDMTFVGPEAPLAAGIVDKFQSSGLPIVGPIESAARLESSKVFAKNFMARFRIPTASFRVAESPLIALETLRRGEVSIGGRVVLKADGLAAGKGVIIADSLTEAEQAVTDLMVKALAGKEAGSRLVIEEPLEGKEASLLLFADGRDYAVMPVARDHKRIGEDDTGPNTGGMGSVTDSSILPPDLVARVLREIVEPTLEGLRAEGSEFKGVLFLGLMLTPDGPKLLEYNVRFGDPETQAILVRLRTDLTAIFEGIRTGKLGNLKVEWSAGASACVVLANGGYPGKYEKGGVIHGLSGTQSDPVTIFHAGTTQNADGQILATGGRVLGVTAEGTDLKQALGRCYDAIENIHWEGMQFRRDIGRSTIGSVQ
ncbi:MAG TPA: phosphoribosylamine--glycine ligase [Pyrinomonadaceae bacterium]|nr:phosphoribosylamine--glycine ligase [Pyrinomonadaceae bacterium]